MIQNQDGVGCVRKINVGATELIAPKYWETAVYQVGEKVLFVVLFNDSGYMRPGDKVPGTVISVFEAEGIRIHRIELDIRWSLKRHPQFKGQKMVVGNVFAHRLRPMEKL